MKIIFGIALILGLFVSQHACFNFTTTTSRDPHHIEVYRFVKQVMVDWNQKHLNDSNEISIMNMDSDNSYLDLIRKAVPKENSVLFIESGCKDKGKYSNLKQSSIFIIISRILKDIHHYVNQLLGCIDFGFWTPLTNVLVILSGTVHTLEDYQYPVQVLTATRTLNYIIPYFENGKIIKLFKGDILFKKAEVISATTDTDILFNDKLSDMRGYGYTVMTYKLEEQLMLRGNKVLMTEVLLIETIARQQNAFINRNAPKITGLKDLENSIMQGTIDMVANFGSLSSLFGNSSVIKSVNTYETNGYCALVPIRLNNEALMKFLMKPFQEKVWYVFILSAIMVASICELFCKITENHMIQERYKTIDILLAFVQQSVAIRKGRFVLKIMMQSFVFSMIVVANIYQGMITSILLEPKKHHSIDNIHELYTMDYEFYSDTLFVTATRNYEPDSKIIEKTKMLDEWVQNSVYIQQFQNVMTSNPKNVLIVLCDVVEELLNTQINAETKARDVYYEFHQKLIMYYEEIVLTRRSPFYEKLGDMSLRIHESGIKQYWSMLLGSENLKSNVVVDSTILGFEEMKPVFKTGRYCLMFAGLIFLIEYFKNGLKLFYRRWIKGGMKFVWKYMHRRVRPRLQRV